MKTKIIPFNLETAKKIQAGEIEGKIKTIHKQDVRIVCWDRMDDETPIIALIQFNDWEGLFECNSIGEYIEGSDDDARSVHLVLEVPDNELQGESKQNFETVAESNAYAKGYKNGFEAGRCVAFDDNKGRTLKTNEPQFKPFDKVLVREQSTDEWKCDYFSHTQNDGVCTYYVCIGGEFLKCITYEGNQELVGTCNEPKCK